MYKALISLVLFFGIVAHSDPSLHSKYQYLSALEQFEKTFHYQVDNVFLRQVDRLSEQDVQSKEAVRNEIQQFRSMMEKSLKNLAISYEAQFINPGKETNIEKSFTEIERETKWYFEIVLNSMAELLLKLNSDHSTRLTGFVSKIRKLNRSLSLGQPLKPSVTDELYQRLPVKDGQLKTLCSIAWGICQNKKIQDLLEGLPYSAVVKKDTTFDMSSIQTLQLPKESAVILVFNHENTIGDQKLMQLLTEKMGLRNNMLTTTLVAWPHTNLIPARNYFFNREKDSVFIEDPNMNQKVMTHLQQSEATPSVSYFPEGDQTFWSSHFPVAAKYGGFVMARKAAVKLKEVGRPVYLISVYMDFWDQMTTSKSELRIQAAAPVLVPSHPMSKRDEWVESQKIKFENNVNKTRGTHQVDLKKPQKVQGVWQSNRTCKDLFIEP